MKCVINLLYITYTEWLSNWFVERVRADIIAEEIISSIGRSSLWVRRWRLHVASSRASASSIVHILVPSTTTTPTWAHPRHILVHIQCPARARETSCCCWVPITGPGASWGKKHLVTRWRIGTVGQWRPRGRPRHRPEVRCCSRRWSVSVSGVLLHWLHLVPTMSCVHITFYNQTLWNSSWNWTFWIRVSTYNYLLRLISIAPIWCARFR